MKGITVGVVYYNEGSLLTECLNSLVGQLPEVILVYDNGSENSAEAFIPPGMPVKIIRGENNRGPSYARNRILDLTETEFLHFHDADDWFSPEWLPRVRAALERGNQVVFTEVDSYRQGKLAGTSVVGLKSNLDLIPFCLSHFMLVPCGTYQVDFLKRIGGYRESLWQSEDYDFHIRVALAQPKAECILESLVSIRLRPDSRSTNRRETVRDAIKTLELHTSELDERYQNIVAERLSEFATQLLDLNEKAEAWRVMASAKKIGSPQFLKRSRLFRVLAKGLGQRIAEEISSFVRTFNATVSRG